MLTELDAVNSMLRTIHERPVNSLESLDVEDASDAHDALRESSRSVQASGWHFNTELNKVYKPDEFSSHIVLPASAIEADAVGTSRGMKVAVRQFQGLQRLYDIDNHTYAFRQPVMLDVINFLEYEVLPQAARDYICAMACYNFITRRTGSTVLANLIKPVIQDTKQKLENQECRTGDYNMIFGNEGTRRHAYRDRWY